MAKYKLKPMVLEALTFEEFLEIGKQQTDNIYNNRPWSFDFLDYHVTHETDSSYIISSENGNNYYFTSEQVLLPTADGRLDIMDKTQFDTICEPVEE